MTSKFGTPRRAVRVGYVLACCMLIAAVLGTSSCYSLRGISIAPETETYQVEQFGVATSEAPPEVGQTFTERLKERVNQNTRLAFDTESPDVTFAGTIVGFSVTPEAPNANNRSDQSRLTIRIAVDYIDNVTEANSYSQTFTDFEAFDANADLLSVQDQLVATLFERISEEAFNKAFSNW